MPSTIFNSSSNRQYINGILVDGLDIEGKYTDKNNHPRFNITSYNPLNKKYMTLTNADINTYISKPKRRSGSVNKLIKTLKRKMKAHKKRKSKKRKSKKRKSKKSK